MLDALQYADDSEKDGVITGLAQDFNPDHFDIDMVNRVLGHLLFDESVAIGI